MIQSYNISVPTQYVDTDKYLARQVAEYTKKTEFESIEAKNDALKELFEEAIILAVNQHLTTKKFEFFWEQGKCPYLHFNIVCEDLEYTTIKELWDVCEIIKFIGVPHIDYIDNVKVTRSYLLVECRVNKPKQLLN